MGTFRSMPKTSSWVRVRNCEVLVLSGIMTWAWTPETPGTAAISAIFAAESSPPAVKPVPMPIPSPATEICPSTKRSPPSMKRVIRSAMAPRATRPATPTAMPTTVKVYPRGRSSRSFTPSGTATVSRSPLEPGLDGQVAASTPPSIESDDGEEEDQGQAHAPAHAEKGAPRQHPGDAVEHGKVLPGLEKDLEEGWLVVLTDEAHEGSDASLESPLVGTEAVRLEVVRREGAEDLGRGDLGRLHGHVHARGEDRVDEGQGIAHAEKAVAHHGVGAVGEVGRGHDRGDAARFP